MHPTGGATYSAASSTNTNSAPQHDNRVFALHGLFHGHGVGSRDPWYVDVIEPNLAGATAIAGRWYELLD